MCRLVGAWGLNTLTSKYVLSKFPPQTPFAAMSSRAPSCVLAVAPLRTSYNERCHRVKRQICGNIKKAFFLKLPYSKVRASFTHLGRGGHL